MVNHPNRSKRHTYRLHAKLASDMEPIDWTTQHAQTAHRWFEETVKLKAPIDGGAGRVVYVELFRDEQPIKSAMIGAGR